MTEEQTPLKLDFKPDELAATNSVVSLSSSGISEQDTTLLPDVSFAPEGINGITVDSPRNNSESQPLLGRMESHPQFNHFPGMCYNFLIVFTFD